MTAPTTRLDTVVPVRGVDYDPARPETRAPWLEQRRGGITATEIRDFGDGAKRREIVTGKVTGEFVNLIGIPAIDHGHRREPVIAEWARRKFGIEPCNYVYSRGDNPRHLASPDGVTLDPFTGALEIGTRAVLLEIKTSKHDLRPAPRMEQVNGVWVLEKIDPTSYFAKSNYYTQVQWQMYVMNAGRTLFIYEQHTGEIDPETGTFTPKGVPEAVWIERDDNLIDVLVNKVAPRALAEIDAARLANTASGLPPASDLPAEHAILVADLLAARDAEATAKAAKDKAWAALVAAYNGPEANDQKIDAGVAWVTRSTSLKPRTVVDFEGARAKAPGVVEKYEALLKRHTRIEEIETTSFSITSKREQK